MKFKELFSRTFFYTKLGWGNYIAWWLGAIAYITIIYELVLKYILPASYITYLLIFFGLMLLAFLMGLFMSRKALEKSSLRFIQIPLFQAFSKFWFY